MKIAFVSNYINHHQIPFCNAMYELLEGEFTFVQTEKMEEQRVRMGWHAEERPAYVRCYYEEAEFCRQLILDCDVVLFGGTDEESYIVERLQSGRLVIRISERLYKTGQWKAISPRGLRKKYIDHTKYRKKSVYLLCAGAYVASDFHMVRAYPGKMYCWGYFPETRHYAIEDLLAEKGYGEHRIPYFLWAARMIDWKHPELALETARYLEEKGICFHMDMIGDGPLRERMESLAGRYGLGDRVTFLGYQSPETVRRCMEKADIYLFTSDRQEGWGAVANEAMNSGCVLIADHMIGSAPYLIQNGENGYIYRDKHETQLFSLAEQVAKDQALRRRLGGNAYRTITQVWNAENAARRLMELIRGIMEGEHSMEGGRSMEGEHFMEGGRSMEGEHFMEGGRSMEERRNDQEQPGSMRPAAPCLPAPCLSEHWGRSCKFFGR